MLLLAVLVLLPELYLRLQVHRAWPAEFRATLSGPEPASRQGEGRTRMADVLRASDDPRVFFELKPNLRVQYKGALLATDELGFIQRSESPPPPRTGRDSQSVRVLSLGGSFLMPQGCPPGTDCVSQLVESVQAQRPEQSWELYNASAPLQRLAMKVDWLEARAGLLDPDLVLVGFGPVDLNLPSYLPTPPSAFDLGRSFLWDWLAGSRSTLSFVDRQQLAWHDDPTVEAADLPAGVQSLVGYEAGIAALDRLKRLVETNGWELAFVTNLEFGQVPWIIEQARARGLHVFSGHRALLAIQAFDSDGAFPQEAYMRSRLVQSSTNPQPSSYQHEVLAVALEADLHERGVLPRLLNKPRIAAR